MSEYTYRALTAAGELLTVNAGRDDTGGAYLQVLGPDGEVRLSSVTHLEVLTVPGMRLALAVLGVRVPAGFLEAVETDLHFRGQAPTRMRWPDQPRPDSPTQERP